MPAIYMQDSTRRSIQFLNLLCKEAKAFLLKDDSYFDRLWKFLRLIRLGIFWANAYKLKSGKCFECGSFTSLRITEQACFYQHKSGINVIKESNRY